MVLVLCQCNYSQTEHSSCSIFETERLRIQSLALLLLPELLKNYLQPFCRRGQKT